MISNLKIAVSYGFRGKIAYELALGLSRMGSPDGPEITVSLGAGNSRLGGFGGPELLEKREFDLAFLNPSAMSYMALNGIEPFRRKIDIRNLAVFPSWDRIGFAIKKSLGVRSLQEVGARRIPLRLSTRIQGPYGTTEFTLRKVLSLYGWSLEELVSWGGKVEGVPFPEHSSRTEGLKRRAYDAVFDEGIRHWADIVLDQDMTFLPLEDSVLKQMEAIGFQRKPIPRAKFKGLEKDVSTLDFSGWPLFCRADLPEEDAYTIVKAIDLRKDTIQVDAERLEMTEICRDTDGGPQCIPLHAGAERYYKEHEYLS